MVVKVLGVLSDGEHEGVQQHESITDQLRKLLLEGISPEAACIKVLAPYGGHDSDPLCIFVWPVLLKTARNMEGKAAGETARDAMHGKPDAQVRLRKTSFRLGNKTVLWEDLTIEHLEAKIAFIRTHVGTMVENLDILVATRDLMNERQVGRLGDIENWTELVQERASVLREARGAEATTHGSLTVKLTD